MTTINATSPSGGGGLAGKPADAWPSLPETWPETRSTLHMWTQIVGKLRLKLSPPQNHFWHSTLYVTPHGLTTSPMPYGTESFQIDFDFLNHQLLIDTSWGPRQVVALEPKSVADFYAEVMAALAALGIQVSIWTRPVEVPDPVVPFEQDRVHAAYDPSAAHAFWRVLLQTDRVFKQFRVLLARGEQRWLLAWQSERAADLLQLRRARPARLAGRGGPAGGGCVQCRDGRVRPAL